MTLSAQLTHFGVHTTDLDRMVDFYTRVMGFVISDHGTGRSGARVVFMTQNPECHHQFVLFDGKPADLPYNPVNQISYRLNSLDTLKGYRRALIKEGITEHRVTDHGNAWALYFKDPEGNPVELYVNSPFYTPQPCGEPLDLDQPNDEILRRTETMCRGRPRFMTREAWMKPDSGSAGRSCLKIPSSSCSSGASGPPRCGSPRTPTSIAASASASTPTHEAAARGELDGLAGHPEGALALVLLLDQYPRNAFRDTPRMYATDAMARNVADQAIAAGHDRAVAERSGACSSICRSAIPRRWPTRSAASGWRRASAILDQLACPAPLRHRPPVRPLSPSQRHPRPRHDGRGAALSRRGRLQRLSYPALLRLHRVAVAGRRRMSGNHQAVDQGLAVGGQLVAKRADIVRRVGLRCAARRSPR